MKYYFFSGGKRALPTCVGKVGRHHRSQQWREEDASAPVSAPQKSIHRLWRLFCEVKTSNGSGALLCVVARGNKEPLLARRGDHSGTQFSALARMVAHKRRQKHTTGTCIRNNTKQNTHTHKHTQRKEQNKKHNTSQNTTEQHNTTHTQHNRHNKTRKNTQNTQS